MFITKKLVGIGSSKVTEYSPALSGKVTYKKHTQFQYWLLNGEVASRRRKAMVLLLEHIEQGSEHCTRSSHRREVKLSCLALQNCLQDAYGDGVRTANLSDSMRNY